MPNPFDGGEQQGAAQADGNTGDLEARVSALEARVDALEGKEKETPETENAMGGATVKKPSPTLAIMLGQKK